MSEYISIKDFANKAGVSPQAIYQRLGRDLKPFLKVVEGKKSLNIEALSLFDDNMIDNNGFKEVYYLYRHTAPSGKIYIGITTLKPLTRWQNGIGYKYNVEFYNDILSFGWDKFKHEILGSNLSRTEAEAEEARLILEHKSHMPENGYNKQFKELVKEDIKEVENISSSLQAALIEQNKALQDTLKILSNQLEVKDTQISELNERLKEAQALNQNNQILLGAEQSRTNPALRINENSPEQSGDIPIKKKGFWGLFRKGD